MHSYRSSKSKLLSSAAQDFLHRRVCEIIAIILGCVGIYLLLVFISYDSSDPSWNTAIDGPVQNLGGALGAIIADLGWQSFGFASLTLPMIMFSWAKLKFQYQTLRKVWFKLCTLPLMLLAFSVALASVTPLWSGAIGWLLKQKFQHVLSLAGTNISFLPIGGCFLLLAIIFFYSAAGIQWQEWRKILNISTIGLMKICETLLWAFKTVRSFTFSPPLSAPAPKEALKTEQSPPAHSVPLNAVAPAPAVSNGITDEEELIPLDLSCSQNYQLPPLNLLATPKEEKGLKFNQRAMEEKAILLKSVLEDFGIRGEISKIRPGPVVTLFELVPAAGTKSSRVIGLSDDIARSMSAISARVAVIPGCNAIGIELPNEKRQTVYLKELLGHEVYEKSQANLALALGNDIGGSPVIVDLARMPHLLVAGTTGSGKSVSINTMILSLIYRMSPEQCKLIMIDPKMLELSVYDGIPHLLTPVVTEPQKAVLALKWAVREMEDRYRAMSKLSVRNIIGYNSRVRETLDKGERLTRQVQTGFDPETQKPVFETQDLDLQPLPYIVVVVDEMADLMLVAGKDIESAVQRLAQMARAAGIHLIMATQRPSVDVITGTIKANFPTRISFAVSSKIDSRTILGDQGAEQLLGQGDMLYMASVGRVARVHGPFVSDLEVENIVNFLKSQSSPDYISHITEEVEGGFDDLLGKETNSGDELYDQALSLILREGKASTSFVQRHLQIGYNRAARIIERMESEGVVSRANHVGKREILLQSSTEERG